MKIKLFLILNLFIAQIFNLKTEVTLPKPQDLIVYSTAFGCTLLIIYGIQNLQNKNENGIMSKLKLGINKLGKKIVQKLINKQITKKLPKIAVTLGIIGLAGCGIYQIKENHEIIKNLFNS